MRLLLSPPRQSPLNVSGVGRRRPGARPGLSQLGIEEAAGLGRQLAGVGRPLRRVRLPLAQEPPASRSRAHGRDPHVVDGDLDDVRVGDLEGDTLAAYRAWSTAAPRPTASRAARPARGRTTLCGRPRTAARAERGDGPLRVPRIPVRYAVDAAAGSTQLDGPLHDVERDTVPVRPRRRPTRGHSPARRAGHPRTPPRGWMPMGPATGAVSPVRRLSPTRRRDPAGASRT